MAEDTTKTQPVVRIVDDGSGSPTIVTDVGQSSLVPEKIQEDQREWVTVEEE